MSTPKKKRKMHNILDELYKRKLNRLKLRLRWKKKEEELKSKVYEESHSIFWVWEFSKKAVLICFIFYVIVQLYSMIVMITYCDFTHLGDLITKTGEIVENCVFAYLAKSGVENVGKIFMSYEEPEPEDECEEDSNGVVG